jgi:hypothetical protein
VRDQKSALDAGPIHSLDQLFERQPVHQRGVDIHLTDEEPGSPTRSMRQGLRRPDVDDGVDGPHPLAHRRPLICGVERGT